jgi:hypothetical protein
MVAMFVYGSGRTFRSDPLTNMATICDSCFWLVNFYKSFPLKPLAQMNPNLVESIYNVWKILYTIAYFVLIH